MFDNNSFLNSIVSQLFFCLALALRCNMFIRLVQTSYNVYPLVHGKEVAHKVHGGVHPSFHAVI